MGEMRKEWVCEYCEEEFETPKEAKKHEVDCKNKPLKIKAIIKHKIGVRESIKLGMGLAIGLILGTIILGLLIILLEAILGISILKSIS
jgi:hypothetical protein